MPGLAVACDVTVTTERSERASTFVLRVVDSENGPGR